MPKRPWHWRLDTERIYIVPTAQGMVVLAAAFAILIGAALTSNGRALLVGFCFMLVWLVALIQTNQNLKGVRAVKLDAAPCPQDGIVRLRVVLENNGGQPRLATRATADLEGLHVRQHAFVETARPGVLATGEAAFEAVVRGVFPLSRIKLSTVYPLGLFYAWKLDHVGCDVVIFPKPKGVLPLPAMSLEDDMRGKDALGAQKAAAAPPAKSSGAEGGFAGHRPYVSGDSLRDVDWKAYARGRRPLVTKQFEEGGMRVLSWSDTPAHIDAEARLAQLSAWIHEAHARRESFLLDLPGQACGPSLGEDHFQICLAALARFDVSGAS